MQLSRRSSQQDSLPTPMQEQPGCRMCPNTITARTRDRWLDQAERAQQVDLCWETVQQDLKDQAAERRQQGSGSSGQCYDAGDSGESGGGGAEGGGANETLCMPASHLRALSAPSGTQR